MTSIPPDISDKYLTLSSEVLSKDDVSKTQGQVKKLVVLLYKMLSPAHRRAFVEAIDENYKFNPALKRSQQEREEALVVEMIEGWPSVLPSVAVTEKSFALSIMKNRKNPNWWPSEKQIHVMKELWVARHETSDEGDLIE